MINSSVRIRIKGQLITDPPNPGPDPQHWLFALLPAVCSPEMRRLQEAVLCGHAHDHGGTAVKEVFSKVTFRLLALLSCSRMHRTLTGG